MTINASTMVLYVWCRQFFQRKINIGSMYIPSVISRLFFDMDRVVDKLMKCECDTYTLKLAIEYLYGRHDQCESTTDAILGSG